MTFTVRDCETSAKTVHCRVISPSSSQQELGPTTYSVSNDYTVCTHALLHDDPQLLHSTLYSDQDALYNAHSLNIR